MGSAAKSSDRVIGAMNFYFRQSVEHESKRRLISLVQRMRRSLSPSNYGAKLLIRLVIIPVN